MTLLDTRDFGWILAIVVFGWVGLWLLLPHRHGGARTTRATSVGALLAGITLLLILPLLTPPGPLLPTLFFYAFSILALVGAVLMITARDPVYSALWFATVVLSSSGLFLLAGAQFLAAGTVIVYAGAIIVTFLFVLMLAQSHGQAIYDRSARRPLASSFTSLLLLGALVASIIATGSDVTPETPSPVVSVQDLIEVENSSIDPVALVASSAVRETARLPKPVEFGQRPPHVAGLGGTLFTDHLLTVEVIGLLLFIALIGAVAIATPRTPVRPDRSGGSAPGSSSAPAGTA
ncbi:NADH-quinone oxidoreductase subunit J family protein [Tautonia marina]|uniref:NADH-quinone oxidoreductase subunit J family protein n=1 Tax=Tautonia marina TaxID=2653855 RepID=UPI00191C1309|nr:NADH-quinone oxidoreductase subunit J [Tautonia marina]